MRRELFFPGLQRGEFREVFFRGAEEFLFAGVAAEFDGLALVDDRDLIAHRAEIVVGDEADLERVGTMCELRLDRGKRGRLHFNKLFSTTDRSFLSLLLKSVILLVVLKGALIVSCPWTLESTLEQTSH